MEIDLFFGISEQLGKIGMWFTINQDTVKDVSPPNIAMHVFTSLIKFYQKPTRVTGV